MFMELSMNMRKKKSSVTLFGTFIVTHSNFLIGYKNVK